MTDPQQITEALAAPFAAAEVKFRPAAIAGNRALALHYVDARVVQERLDDVLGVAGWQDEYQCLPDGSVVCRLRLRMGDEWITKEDVGGPSDQPDGGDRMKAAFSDALKRAAVKFGVGRYLYRLPSTWCDYDPQKKCFAKPPTLPAWAKDSKAAPKEKLAGRAALLAPAHDLTPPVTPLAPTFPQPWMDSTIPNEIKGWPSVLTECRTAEDFNRIMPDWKALPSREVKAAAWQLVQRRAIECDLKWTGKEFVHKGDAPQKEAS